MYLFKSVQKMFLLSLLMNFNVQLILYIWQYKKENLNQFVDFLCHFVLLLVVLLFLSVDLRS